MVIGLAVLIVFTLLNFVSSTTLSHADDRLAERSVVFGVVMLVVSLPPLVFMFLGAHHLKNRGSFPLAVVGVVFAGLGGLAGIIPTGFLALITLRLARLLLRGLSDVFPYLCIFSFLLLIVGGFTLFAGGGAIKGLLALTNPDVREGFGGQLRQRAREESERERRAGRRSRRG
jgi:hypothetical protein